MAFSFWWLWDYPHPGKVEFALRCSKVLRNANVDFIACTSSSSASLLKSLGAHEVINYKTDHPSSSVEFSKTPFDFVFDCAEGDKGYFSCVNSGILKASGYWVGIVMPDPDMEINSFFAIARFAASALSRTLYTRVNPFKPKYTLFLPSPSAEGMKKVSHFPVSKWLGKGTGRN